jgi:Ran GTPase-activating protein (RanGAP) involved in mRNA processing and transport
MDALANIMEVATSLHELIASWNEISDMGAISLAAGLQFTPNMRRLELENNEIEEVGCGAAMAALMRHRSRDMSGTALQYLGLNYNRVSDSGCEKLSELADALTHMESLCLASNEIGPYGSAALARAFKRWEYLRWLNLSRNPLGDSGIHALLDELSRCDIELFGIDLTDTRCGSDGATALSVAAPHLNSLRDLRIGENDIGPEGITILSSGLRNLDQLLYLELADTAMGCRALCDALLPALVSIPHLLYLGLRRNNITSSTAVECVLSACSNHLRELTTLSLEQNGFDESCADALAAMQQQALCNGRILKIVHSLGHEQGNFGARSWYTL